MARVPRTLVLVGVASLLTDASTEMVYPLLPSLLASLGATGFALGIMEGLGEATSSYLKLLAGRWSDRLGRRKPLALAGYAFSGVAKLGYAFVLAPWHVVAARTADRFGKGVRGAPRDALIADSVARERWGFAYGFHRAMDTTGALLGPLVGVLLIAVFAFGVRSLVWAALVPAVLALVALGFVRETQRPGARPGAAMMPRDPRLVRYLMVVALASFLPFGVIFVLQSMTEDGLTLTETLLAYAAFNVAYAALAVPFGRWADRVGHVNVLAVSFALFATAGMATAVLRPDALAEYLLPAAMFGAATAAFEGNARAVAADLGHRESRGTVLGAFHATLGAASLAAGISAGLLWTVDSTLFFAALAGVALAALGLLLAFRRGPGRWFDPPRRDMVVAGESDTASHAALT